jgi:hypothetical protein
MWAVAFALLAFEACTSNEPERRFYCFPCMMPTKWSPLLLLVLFSVLMGASIDSYIGLALGTIWSMVDAGLGAVRQHWPL